MVRNTQSVAEEIVCGYVIKGFQEPLLDSDGFPQEILRIFGSDDAKA